MPLPAAAILARLPVDRPIRPRFPRALWFMKAPSGIVRRSRGASWTPRAFASGAAVGGVEALP